MADDDKGGREYLELAQAALFLKRGTSTLVKWRKAGFLANQRAWTRAQLREAEAKAAAVPPRAKTGGRRRASTGEVPPAPAQVEKTNPGQPEPTPASEPAPAEKPATLDLNLPAPLPAPAKQAEPAAAETRRRASSLDEWMRGGAK